MKHHESTSEHHRTASLEKGRDWKPGWAGEVMKPLISPPPNEVAVVPPPPPPPLEGRDSGGRFALGNPGKPRGARSKVAAEIDKMLEEAAPDAFETIRQAG